MLQIATLSNMTPSGTELKSFQDAEIHSGVLNQNRFNLKRPSSGDLTNYQRHSLRDSQIQYSWNNARSNKELTRYEICSTPHWEDKAIWHRRKGTQDLNTRGRGRQLDSPETN